MTAVPARWRKSSFTAQEADCVEVRNTLDAVRDTKDRSGPVLAVPEFGELIAGVKAGKLDR